MASAKSRTVNSARNVVVSIVAQVAHVIMGFAIRTAFIAELGVAMLGVHSLITSVLAVLALADLGINGAIMYALYKPLKEGDMKSTAAVARYATILYRRIALIVLILGLAFTPFLHKLVRLDSPVEMLEVYYLVLLANTVITYLMQNRVILLNADQKIYLTKTYSMIFNLLRGVAQIISLVAFSSFLVFLIIQVVFTLANNLAVYVKAGQLYPFIRSQAGALDNRERTSIWSSTKAMMLYRISILALNQSTAVFISVLVGTVALGYYSNYLLIVGAAVMVTESAFGALTPSIGNLVASDDKERQREVFDSVMLISLIVHGMSAVAIVTLIDDFITVWVGADFTLSTPVVTAIAVNFYVAGIVRTLWSFLAATGLFRRTQGMIFVTAVLGIVLALILGNVFGLVGIVAAPTLAQLLTQAWYEPWVLARYQFARKVLPYYLVQLGVFALWGSIALATFIVGDKFAEGALESLILKGLVLGVLLTVGSWLTFRRTKAFKSLVKRLRNLSPRRRTS